MLVGGLRSKRSRAWKVATLTDLALPEKVWR
jgi:hypothetical protein